MAKNTDLFGNPWVTPPDPRGRKAHVRNAEVAEKVAILRASGLNEEEIAERGGMSVPTLRKYYFRELEQGATLVQAALVEDLWTQSKAGKVSASRTLLNIFERGKAAVPVTRQKRGQAKPEKLGKKASANVEARTAHEGTGWGGLLKH